MYLKYYGLTVKPFENTPDPRFLFPSKSHREVLASLRYGVDTAKGFILITERKIVPLILMIALFVTFSITTLALIKPIRVRLFEEDYGAAKTRIPMAAVASNMIYQHPWLGVGFVNYTSVSSRYDRTRESISYVFPWPVHNEFLLIAAELGLPALGLFLFILIVVFRMLFRIGHSHGDPFISHTAIGLFGGLAAWCIHLQVEFAYVLITMPIWAFIGVIQAMEQIANENADIKKGKS